MLTKNKKIIIIISVILIIIGVVILIYFLWLKKQPEVFEEKIVQKLTEEKVQGVKFIAEENKLRFLSLKSNTFKELNFEDNKLSELSKIPMYLVQNIIWSPDGKKAILKVENNQSLLSQEGYLLDKNAPDGTITTWSFNLISGDLIELSRGIVGIDWLNENKIIYYYSKIAIDSDIEPEQAGTALVEANFDGSNYQKIMDLDVSKFYNPKLVLAPDKNQAILSPEAEGVGKNYIYIVDLKSKTIKNITEGELTVLGSWSSNGKNIFLYQADTKTPDSQLYDLWYANDKGVDKKKLGVTAAYPLAITDSEDKYIYIASVNDNNQVIYQINSGSLEKKIITDSAKEKDLINITEIGLLQNNIFVVANDYLYLIKI